MEHENEIKCKYNIDKVVIAIPLPSQQFPRTFYRAHFQDPTISETTIKYLLDLQQHVIIKRNAHIAITLLPHPQLSGNTHVPCQNNPLPHWYPALEIHMTSVHFPSTKECRASLDWLAKPLPALKWHLFRWSVSTKTQINQS